MYNEDILP